MVPHTDVKELVPMSPHFFLSTKILQVTFVHVIYFVPPQQEEAVISVENGTEQNRRHNIAKEK